MLRYNIHLLDVSNVQAQQTLILNIPYVYSITSGGFENEEKIAEMKWVSSMTLVYALVVGVDEVARREGRFSELRRSCVTGREFMQFQHQM